MVGETPTNTDMAILSARCHVCQADYDASGAPLRCPSCDALLPPHPRVSPFAQLGLPVSTSLDDAAVEQAWLKRSRLVHPDRFASRPAAERRAAAEQTIAANDAYRLLKTPFDRAVWLVRSAGVDEPRLSQARLIAFMEDREEAEASSAGRARVIAAAAARFQVSLAAVVASLAEVDWQQVSVAEPGVWRPRLVAVASHLADMRTLGRLSADLGGPTLIAGMDGR